MTKDVLAFCNGIRAKNGYGPCDKLQPGRRSISASCPVSRTIYARTPLRVNTQATEVCVTETYISTRYPLPPVVCKFIREFDNGLYPDLVL